MDSNGVQGGDVSGRNSVAATAASTAFLAVGGDKPLVFELPRPDAVIAQIAPQHNATVKMLRGCQHQR